MNSKARFFEELTLDIRGAVIFLDADGTLLPDREHALSESVRAKVKAFAQNNRIYLCINARTKERNEYLSRELGVPLVARKHKKPSTKVLLEVPEDERHRPLLVIGDKWFTDGIFARRINARFIRVRRKISGRERLLVRLAIWFDDFSWKFFRKVVCGSFKE